MSDEKNKRETHTFGNDVHGSRAIMESDELAAERRALRVLLDSFHAKRETLLEETLDDTATRRNMGRFIGHTLVKPYWE